MVQFFSQEATPTVRERSVFGSPAAPGVPSLENGRPICEEIHFQRKPGGAPLGGALLRRIPLGDYVRRAVDAAGQWRVRGEGPIEWKFDDGESYPARTEPAGDGYVATPVVGVTQTKEYKAATRARRRPGRVADETHLLEVADVYRRAKARGEPPTKAVMVEWDDASRSTASRWVRRARDAGHIPPPRPRAAGERV